MLPRQGHTADVIGDYLYVFGGYDLNLVLYSFKRLHVLSGDWSDVPISPDCSSLPGGVYYIYNIIAFHIKLAQSLHVMYPRFGQDITRFKYFHHVL